MVAVVLPTSGTPTISEDAARRYAHVDPGWGFGGLGYITYKRTYARPVDWDENGVPTLTEEWHETVRRVVNGAQAIGANLTRAELERLYDYIFYLKGSVSGRALWQLGTPNNARLGGDSLCNCWFVDVNEVDDFRWATERLMLGGGVGFSCDKPERLGTVRQGDVSHKDVNDADFIVPDSREGWGELIYRAINAYLGDQDTPSKMVYATHLVRKKGEPINGFGGTASGPEILIEGVEKICKVLDNAVNKTLSDVDVMDIMNIIGSIVVAGNVRRSAEIALGNINSDDYLMAKRWDLGPVPNERAMSNNSVYVTAQRMKDMPDLIWEGYRGNGEPYGFFNLEASQEFGRIGELRPDYTIAGVNPCAEIPLSHRESCNLGEIYLPRLSSQEEMIDLASLLYKVQKAIAAMPYLDRRSSMITSRNMRLGIGVTGIQQSLNRLTWLSPTYEALRALDAKWSKQRGWPESVRLTTVKPSGTLSILAGVTPGENPGFSRYHIRRVRIAANHDQILDYCKEVGYPMEPVRNFDGSEDKRTMVVEFPCEFPEGTVTADMVSAIDQLDLVRFLQREWADNAVSVTVYFAPEELEGIQEYLAEHWHEMKSVSFLLQENHGFDQAPLEAISKSEYDERIRNLHRDPQVTIYGNTVLAELDSDCAGSSCPVR